jgi:hypothetical protein
MKPYNEWDTPWKMEWEKPKEIMTECNHCYAIRTLLIYYGNKGFPWMCGVCGRENYYEGKETEIIDESVYLE